MSKITKFGCEMLYNAENIALQSSQILYNFPHAIQKYTKFARARLYLMHLTTFRNQTLQFYSFQYALSSCSDLFAYPCLEVVYNRNCLLRYTILCDTQTGMFLHEAVTCDL